MPQPRPNPRLHGPIWPGDGRIALVPEVDRADQSTLRPTRATWPGSLRTMVQALLLVVAGVFLALHAVHLKADFPNHSPWMDWAKYTDEGWYGDAAIRHYQRGHWNVPGDFNPAAALPVWPLVEAVLFRFTGVSLVAVRALTVAIFGLILAASFLLLRRWRPDARRRSLGPAAAVLLLAVSPFCFVFTRMAILEPLLVLWMLLALLAASSTRGWAVPALGVLLPLMVLTKTTAIFMIPAVAWLMWARAGFLWRPFLRRTVPTGALALTLWASYFALFVRPRFLEDFRYLFSANAYTGITLANAASVLRKTFADGFWIGRVLYPAGLAACALAVLLLLRRRSSRSQPLIVALMLWAAGYFAFLAYHNNLQPRYYLVVAVPITLVIPLVLEELIARLSAHRTLPRLLAATAAASLLGAIALPDARQTLQYVRHPEYTFVAAAEQVHRIVAATPTQNPLVLSISGSDLSLITGLPSICDDFGTMELAQRVATYRPGWYAAWNQIDDDKMEALAPLFHVERVAAFPAYDDPNRNLLILYRLDPADAPPPPRRRRKPVPRLLRTAIGQQPSVTQLEH